VVRQTEEPIDVSLVGRVVAEEARLTLSEVTGPLRRSKGIILSSAALEVARRVARRVQAMGVPALVIREEELVSLPEARLAARAAVTPTGCRFELGREVVESSWEDVYLMVAGRMVEDKPTPLPQRLEPAAFPLLPISVFGGFPVAVQPWRPFKYRPGAETVFLRLEFFLFDPWQRLRVDEGRTQCFVPRSESEGPQAPKGSESLAGMRLTSNVELFARAATELAPQVSVSDFVRLLAGGDYVREGRRFEFDSALAFDSYCHWLLQLEEQNRPPEGGADEEPAADGADGPGEVADQT
jgi:hypothetical protein